MAGEAEDHQVLLGVVAAREDAAPVVHVQPAFAARHPADLAAAAAGGDQPAAAGGRQLGGARTAVVGRAQPFPH